MKQVYSRLALKEARRRLSISNLYLRGSGSVKGF
jgi:hypothetical protein